MGVNLNLTNLSWNSEHYIKMIGIYKFTCCINNKIYIGSSTNLQKRYWSHMSMLRKNKHTSIHLQRAFNKYGEKAFKYEILEVCEIDQLITREQFYLDTLLNANENSDYFDEYGFNILRIAGSRLGSKQSKNSILKSIENNPNIKKINHYSYCGEFLKTYSHGTEASKELKVSASSILSNARGKTKYTNIGIFIFENEVENNIEYLKSLRKHPINTNPWNKGKSTPPTNNIKVEVVDIYGNLIGKFNSKKECAQYLNVMESTIANNANVKLISKKWWCVTPEYKSEILIKCKKYSDYIKIENKGSLFSIFDLYGNYLHSWDSVKECALTLNIKENSIYYVLCKKRNTYNNLIFKYNDDIV